MHGDLGQSLLEKDGKGPDCTNSWRGCVKRGQLSAVMAVAERGLRVTSGAISIRQDGHFGRQM